MAVQIVGGIDPIALGIISDPPVLVLTYEISNTTLSSDVKRHRRQRRMPMRLFTDRSDVNKTYFVLKQRHELYLSVIPSVTVLKMLRVLQEVMKGLRMDEAVEKVDSEFGIDPDEDLNKVSLDQLAQKKEIMDEGFLKKLVKPGDPGFVYDKVENFEVVAKEPSDWDEDEDSKVGEKTDTKIQLGDVKKPVDTKSVTADFIKVEISSQEIKDEDKHASENEEPEKFASDIPPVHEIETMEDNQEPPLDEELLLSICDGEIDNDTLLSLCDFNLTNLSLPFGDGDSFTFGDIENPIENGANKDQTMPPLDSSRDAIYLCDEENEPLIKQEVERRPYTIIDIGTSFLSDVSMQDDQEEDEKSDLSRNFPLLKLEMQKSVDYLLQNAARISEKVRQVEGAKTATLDNEYEKVEESNVPEPFVQILNSTEEEKVIEITTSLQGESNEERMEEKVTPVFKSKKDNQLESAVDISNIENLLDDEFWNL